MSVQLKPSRTPAILDAIVAIANEVVPPAAASISLSLQILDGPDGNDDIDRSYLLIGWNGQPDTLGVEIAPAQSQPGARNPEDVDVHGHVSVSSGDRGQKQVRDKVFAVLDAFAAGIAANTRLDGLASRAVLHATGIEPAVGPGAVCTVLFTIHIEGTR